MDIQKLRYVVDLARLKNITHAARENYVAQSTMSAAIASVEAELGFVLFDRGGRQIEPTPAGVAFIERVKRILDDYGEAVREARHVADGQVGSLVIGFNALSVGSRMPGIMRDYSQHGFPETVRFQKGSLSELTDQLLAGKVDVVFSNHFEARRDPSIRYEVIAEARPCLFVPKGHRFAGRASVRPCDLVGERVLCASSATGEPVSSAAAQILSSAGVPYSPESAVGDEEAVVLMVEAGLGVYPAATWYCDALANRVDWVPLELDVESMYITVMWVDEALESRARAVAACVRRAFEGATL